MTDSPQAMGAIDMPDVPDEASRAASSSAVDDGEPDGSHNLDARRSHRAQLRRSALAVGSIALALYIVLGGPAATLALTTAAWQHLSARLFPPPQPGPAGPLLNASYWTAEPLPQGAQPYREIAIGPSPADPEQAYACWLGPQSPSAATGPVNLYATSNGSRSWSALPAPLARAADCRLVPDALDPSRVVLVLDSTGHPACDGIALYASADRGAHWTAIPLPQAVRGACDLSIFAAGGTLYVWSPTAQAETPHAPAAQVLTSADAGLTWRAAFAGLPAGSTAVPLAAHADGSVLVLQSPVRATGGTQAPPPALWCSLASSASPRPLGPLPADAATALVAGDPAAGAGCDWGRIYALTYQPGEDPADPSARVARVQVSQANQWRDVPTLPANGAGRALPLGDDAHILGVGPGGMLLVDVPYTGPAVGLANGAASPAHVTWGWDPASGHWLRNWHIEPANSIVEGFAWDHSHGPPPQLVVWLFAHNVGSPTFSGIFRATISAP